ncbi:Helix-turn-helix domain-containing protein [Haladaptatus litoreus]|uniref:Helix-turn-helix domain-containing protein n=1 Tax=Haladaptatus litoreus TaxID=553468 RepID=A0A1N7EL99_9EURY|nr:helix-turn-helix domain-containing protein [Haladaptatus litoreus]SIR88847.1 Helix-turn-helix domain-containing protein [Haladaptatus litoreus]
MNNFLQKLSGTRSQPAQQGTLCDLADDSGARVFSVLSSETARLIYLYLQNTTATASEIAAQVDTSIQNTQYHLTKLQEAELVEITDTEYSSKGSEMNVYAATDDPLIIVSGSESRLEKVRSRLSDLLGGIGLLVVGSLVVEWLANQELLDVRSVSDGFISLASPTGASAEPEPLFWVPPGLIFFAGGLTVLLGAVVWNALQSE